MNRRAAWLVAAGACAALSACAFRAGANEVLASAPERGLVLHDAEETLREWCRPDESGRLWLELPEGLRFELVTSTSDPAIANPGDGSFHPFDPAEVRDAIASVRYPLEGVGADVLMLPYPRRGALESAAGHGLILLSPGTLPIVREHQHAIVTHELGHVVQHALLPDSDAEGWEAYRRLRGIEGAEYAASSPHADRPHEIFAEDFRFLFGGSWATTSGSIENPDLTLPGAVPGLEAFLLGLASERPVAMLSVTPNPARGALEFRASAAIQAPLDVVDIAGRRLARLTPEITSAGTRWRWDGRDSSGGRVQPGVLFARVRGLGARALPVTLLPD